MAPFFFANFYNYYAFFLAALPEPGATIGYCYCLPASVAVVAGVPESTPDSFYYGGVPVAGVACELLFGGDMLPMSLLLIIERLIINIIQ